MPRLVRPLDPLGDGVEVEGGGQAQRHQGRDPQELALAGPPG
jgi:hypothetical protein